MKKILLFFILLSLCLNSGCVLRRLNNDEDTTTAPATVEPTTQQLVLERSIAASDRSYFFGISPADSYFIPREEWDAYTAMGVTSLRLQLQSGHDWIEYDAILEKAAQNDIEVVMQVGYDSYDAAGERYESGNGTVMHITNAMGLVKSLAKAIPHFYSRGVAAFEIWNEPNGTCYLSPNEYAQLLTTVYEKIKYTDKLAPEATVVFGGLDASAKRYDDGINTQAKEWLERFYKSTAYTKFYEKYNHPPYDAIAIHPYHTIDIDSSQKLTQNDLNDAITQVITDQLTTQGDSTTPIWITQLGDDDPDDDRQAAKLEHYMNAAYANPRVARLHWFKYTFYGSDYSLVREDGTPRPALASYARTVRSLMEQ